MNKSIFREYDIRGVYGKDIDESFAFLLGQAYARKLKEELATKTSYMVAVGRDCRLSGPSLVAQLISGIISEGIDVLDCGMGPTPQLYFAVFHKNLDGGIQVTASHNPGDQNGFKMMIGKGTLSGAAIQDIYKRMKEIQSSANTNESSGVVGQCKNYDADLDYLKSLVEASKSHVGKRKLKVVVDGGNGVGGPVGVPMLKELGCEVIELFTDPDGRFPNHHPDPTVVENIVEMRKRVVDEKADLGIAWDGDADRIGVVDEKGEPIFGDMLLVIFGRALLKEVQSPILIGDVKCSQLMFDTLNAEGAHAVMAKTGHSLIKAKLKELNAELAGEMSGHIFFAHRYYGFDDALHAAARLVEIVSQTNLPVSQLLDGVPKSFNTPEIRFDCADTLKFNVVARAKELLSEYEVNDLDGVRVKFNKGWGLVRASNTQAALVMRFEAEDEDSLVTYRRIFEEAIEKAIKELS